MIPEHDISLEPRVARLETSMETLTRNVDALTNSVSQLSKNIDEKFGALQVGLANANAPKATQWGTVISAIGLIIALGAATLIPLNNATNDNKARIEQYHTSMVEHQKLDMHPVGESRVNAMEKRYDILFTDMVERDKNLDAKTQFRNKS